MNDIKTIKKDCSLLIGSTMKLWDQLPRDSKDMIGSYFTFLGQISYKIYPCEEIINFNQLINVSNTLYETSIFNYTQAKEIFSCQSINNKGKFLNILGKVILYNSLTSEQKEIMINNK